MTGKSRIRADDDPHRNIDQAFFDNPEAVDAAGPPSRRDHDARAAAVSVPGATTLHRM